MKKIIENLNKTVRMIESTKKPMKEEYNADKLVEFYSYVTDINYNDLSIALDRASEASIDLADATRDFISENGLGAIDIIGIANNEILLKGSQQLDELVGINPANEGVYYYANSVNFMAEDVSDDLVERLENALTDDIKSSLYSATIMLLEDMGIYL